MGGFQTRPYEDPSGVNHIPGTAAPQCGKPEIIPKVHTVPVTIGFPGTETVPGAETVPGIIGFPGTAAPQCGISSEVTEANWA